jgi:protein-ribulosamine 3-kinase
MNSTLIQHIGQQIEKATGNCLKEIQLRPLSGGCINNGFEFVTDCGSYFMKTNSADRYPGMFHAEAKGLQTLAETKCIHIPGVVCCGEFENTAFLVLNFILSVPKTKNYWQGFGQQLAALHQNSCNYFGLEYDNYIGSIPQSNTQTENLCDFYVTQRLEPLLNKSLENGLADKELARCVDKLCSRLDQLIPPEKPALLHGDLWSGNVMTGPEGGPCLIDPAVYYGHRETDLAFSTLFGAFPEEFYHSYHNIFPLEQGWRKRIDLFNIYPLFVHLLLFGTSYYPQLKSAIAKYL